MIALVSFSMHSCVPLEYALWPSPALRGLWLALTYTHTPFKDWQRIRVEHATPQLMQSLSGTGEMR